MKKVSVVVDEVKRGCLRDHKTLRCAAAAASVAR